MLAQYVKTHCLAIMGANKGKKAFSFLMSTCLICAVLLAGQSATEKTNPVKAVVSEIVESGQVVGLTDSPSARVKLPREISPGAPPLLTFRFLEGKERHQFNQLNLVIDDAGH